jgi:hypothetical protein
MGKELKDKLENKGCLTDEKIKELTNLFFKKSVPYSSEEMTIRSPGGCFGGPNSMSLEQQDYYGSLLD